MNKRSHSWFKLTLLLLMATALLALNGCEMIKNLDFPWEEHAGVPTKTPVPPVATETQVPTPTQAPVEPTPTQVPRQTRLVLWLPPEFDPEEDNAAAALLKARLERFARNNRIEIDVRLKNPSGSSNVIESLIATNGAAPENLPAVVLLRKQDLDAAYARGLVYVNDALRTLSGDTDWYSFAREAVSHENTSFGIGFLGDPMIMAYQSRLESVPDNNWFALPKSPVRFGFAADDSQGRFMLLLYLAAGGETRDAQNQLILQEEPLRQALQVLADMQSARNLSPAVLQMQTPSAVWQTLVAWNLETAAMPASVVLKALTGDTTGQPELLFTPVDFTLTDSWTLVLANPDEAQQGLGTKLIQDLTETNFLASWSEALGYVPARPTALGAWTNVDLKPALERVMNIARLYPRDETIISLGPILRNAALMIIRDGATVEEAVSQALEGIK